MVSASGSVVVEGGGVEMSIVPGPWWVKMAADDTRTGGNVAIAKMTLVDSIDNMHGMGRVLDCEGMVRRREALLPQHRDFDRLQQAGHTCSTRDVRGGVHRSLQQSRRGKTIAAGYYCRCVETPARSQHRKARILAQMQEGDARKTRR
jgi:hypothetical protein